MAFEEYRNSSGNSLSHEFNIERFAYDVFAYMLRICGFPEEKIPTSSLKDNIYVEDDFILNVVLSALPISLFTRDQWRLKFEKKFEEGGIRNILEIQNYLESFTAYLDEEDILSSIQVYLALYTEFALFLNFKCIEANFDSFPKLWSHWCKELLAQNDEFDPKVEFPFSMCPDISESWITNFIREFAIPYERSDGVSNRFSLHILDYHDQNETFPEETTEGVINAIPEESVAQASSTSDGDTVTFSQEGSNTESNFMPVGCDHIASSSQLKLTEENASVDTKAHGSYRNRLETYTEGCTDVVAVESVAQPFDISDGDTVMSFAESSTSELNFVPFRCSDHTYSTSGVQIPEAISLQKTRAHSKHRNGMTYVLKQCLKGRKRSRSQKLEVEDAFGKLNLEKENVSPENRETKRRCKISGEDRLE